MTTSSRGWTVPVPERPTPVPPLRRRLGPPALTATVVGAAVGLLAVVDPEQPGHYPTCPFLYLTGYYCPGCGSLRAVHALAHGDLGTALDRNVLLVVAVPVLIALFLVWTRRVIQGRPFVRSAPPWVIQGIFVLVAAFWVLRNVPAFSWLAP
jgi:hypothetical protein